MYQKKKDFASIYTKVVTGAAYTTEENCGEIFMKNTGASAARFKGNTTDPASEWVSLGVGESFAFGYVGISRLPFTIDPLLSTVEVSMSL